MGVSTVKGDRDPFFVSVKKLVLYIMFITICIGREAPI